MATMIPIPLITIGIIQASLSKIQGLFKVFPIVFKDFKFIENTDLTC